MWIELILLCGNNLNTLLLFIVICVKTSVLQTQSSVCVWIRGQNVEENIYFQMYLYAYTRPQCLPFGSVTFRNLWFSVSEAIQPAWHTTVLDRNDWNRQIWPKWLQRGLGLRIICQCQQDTALVPNPDNVTVMSTYMFLMFSVLQWPLRSWRLPNALFPVTTLVWKWNQEELPWIVQLILRYILMQGWWFFTFRPWQVT